MKRIGAFEAKNRLSELLASVENGEEVIITKHGRDVARLVPADQQSHRRAAAAITALRALRAQQSLRGVGWRALVDEGRRR
jgi:prevent-host-death family protein